MEFVLVIVCNWLPLDRYFKEHVAGSDVLFLVYISMLVENYCFFAHNIILQLVNVGRMPAIKKNGLVDASSALADICWLYYRWRVAYILSHKLDHPHSNIFNPTYSSLPTKIRSEFNDLHPELGNDSFDENRLTEGPEDEKL
eukprot:NODE_680_length_1269_cov_92.466725_g641_i0.p1 GENE.NODE_680_length_1269_cov_92.466725_g641_i0~~NODE_680_length_1269_cov_92.466725_g641_i0.p1  ORF type:complete len:142 (+),score=14.81 NODE_680_length_1269_cov_92.466725_g641_i0:409-834(+)